MNSEDLAARIAEVTKVISAINWRWDRAFWDTVVSSLQLRPVSAVPSRATFDWRHGFVHAYFEGDVLETVVAELEIYNPREALSATEFDDLTDDYYAKYRAGVAVIKKILGKPEFDDGAAARGFPEDQDAVWLALWRVSGVRFMLQQKNEGPDMPFRLEVIVEK